MVIPEYGRHVQNMVRYARTIEDNEERQHFIEEVVKLMMQMHPQNRNLDDYRGKMWKHVFRIAEYDLDVMPPSGEKPTEDDKRKRPERVAYPARATKFRHYGHNVLTLIEKAIAMEDGPKKDGFVQVIGSYMKLAYKTWNREHYVSDDTIIEDLNTLSKGQLVPVEDASLDNLTRSNMRRNSRDKHRGGRDRDGGGHRSSSRSNNGRRGGGGQSSGGYQKRRRK